MAPPEYMTHMKLIYMLTILLCTEGIFLVCFKIRGDGAPQLPITASVRGAGVVGPPLVDKGEHTGLTSRVATIHWSWSIWEKTGNMLMLK